MGSIDRRDSTPQLLNRLRMRQVALMLAIDQKGTLRGAAAELGLSQPAATKMLHELEGALGLPLFDRVGRGLQLNAAGERVTGCFRHLRGGMEALNRELQELREGSAGRLAVGSIMAASPGRLTQALLALKRQWPLLSIEVAVDTSDRLLAQLQDGVLEVVVGRQTGQADPAHLFRTIDDEALSIIAGCGHPLARARSVGFAAAGPWLGAAAARQPHARADRPGIPGPRPAAAARPDRDGLHPHHHEPGAQLRPDRRDSAGRGPGQRRARHGPHPALSHAP